MAMPPAAIALHEAHLEEARRMADSADPRIAAEGRASRDISLALIRWHESEKAAGTSAELMASALNLVLGHAVAGFAFEHRSGQLLAEHTLAWHLEQIGEVARTALGER